MIPAFLVLFLISILTGCGKDEGEERKITKDLPKLPTNVNLVVNPSFEEWQGGIPKGWQIKHFEGQGKVMQMFGISTDEKHSGKASFYLRGLFNTNRWMVLVQRH